MKKKFEAFIRDDGGKERFLLSVPSDEELKRRYAEFRQFSEKAIARHPEYEGAVGLHREGKFGRAIEAQSRILASDPTFFPSLYELGLIFNELCDYTKAAEYLSEAEKHCENSTILTAISLVRASAEKSLAESVRLKDPKAALSHYACAEELYRANLKEGRLPIDEYVVVLVNYGNLNYSMGRRPRAQDIYSYALGIIKENRDNPELKNLETTVRKFLSDTMG